MKLKLFHLHCGREVLVHQVLDNMGHCPWDGRAFSRDYTALIAEALETAESAGNVLENALEKIAGMEPDITIDRDSLIAPIDAHVDDLERRYQEMERERRRRR